MPRRETDDLDRALRAIFMQEWRVDGFGDQHVADAMRRGYVLAIDKCLQICADTDTLSRAENDLRDYHTHITGQI